MFLFFFSKLCGVRDIWNEYSKACLKIADTLVYLLLFEILIVFMILIRQRQYLNL